MQWINWNTCSRIVCLEPTYLNCSNLMKVHYISPPPKNAHGSPSVFVIVISGWVKLIADKNRFPFEDISKDNNIKQLICFLLFINKNVFLSLSSTHCIYVLWLNSCVLFTKWHHSPKTTRTIVSMHLTRNKINTIPYFRKLPNQTLRLKCSLTISENFIHGLNFVKGWFFKQCYNL